MTTTMKVSDRGISLITSFEGCRLSAYLDSVKVATIGWGHTSGVHMGMTCTHEQAVEWLRSDIAWVEDCINKHVTASLTQNQFDALASFVFNEGCGHFSGSTLLRHLNRGNYSLAAMEFLRWNIAGGVVLTGLTRRRKAEQQLFLQQ